MKKVWIAVLVLMCGVSLNWAIPSPGIAAVPTVTASGGGTYASGTTVTLQGSIFDPEGGAFNYSWIETVNGTPPTITPRCSGSQNSVPANTQTPLPACAVSGLADGTHYFILSVFEVSTGVPAAPVVVKVTLTNDTTAPTLAPTVTPTILWPPNNKPVPVVVTPNASDTSGEAPTVTATVTSNEPVKLTGQGKKSGTNWDTPIYNANGTITFMLPAQRLGNGTGRVYTITVTATDAVGNSSSAQVTVTVPHDQGQKHGKGKKN